MGEDVKSIMESAGIGNLVSILENDENPDIPMDEDIPLTKGAADPSAKPSPSFFMNREEPQEEVSSVKDSITSDFAKKNLTEGSPGVWEEQPIGIGGKSTPEQQKQKGKILLWTHWLLKDQHLRTTRHPSIAWYPWWVRNL